MVGRRLLPALLTALLLSGLLTLWLSKRVAHGTPVATAPTRQLVVAAKDMQAGEPLQADSLKTVEWPATNPLRGTFTHPEELSGRILLTPLSAGDLVFDHQLAATGTQAGLMVRIPEGMRAISLRSDEVAGVAGFLQPGSFVDVLVTYTSPNQPDMITTTVLQNADVLAEGQNLQPDANGKPNLADVVTLLVTPQDAQKLTLASTLGKIHFVLRNGADRREVANLAPQESLSGAAAAHEAPVAPRHASAVIHPAVASFTVDTIAGTKQSKATFEKKDDE